MTTILAAVLDEATVQTLDASLSEGQVDYVPTFGAGPNRCRPGFEITLLEDIGASGSAGTTPAVSPLSASGGSTIGIRADTCDDEEIGSRQPVPKDPIPEDPALAQVLNATVLMDSDGVGNPPKDEGPRSQQPVLSFVSTNPQSAASFDVLCGAVEVVSELQEKGPAAQPVRTLNVSVGRDPANTIVLKDRRISHRHFTLHVRASAEGAVALEVHDQSSNGTFVNGQKVGKGRRLGLHLGDRIVALPAEQVGHDEEIGFQLLHDTKGAACGPSAEAQLSIGDDGPVKEGKEKPAVPKELENDLQCGVCTDIFHRCVTLVPCGHNFCTSCFLTWRQQSSACPGCRAYVRQVVRNQDMDRMVETFLLGHPELARDPAELQEMLAVEQKPENDAMLRWLIKGPRIPLKNPDGDRLNVATPQRQRRQARRSGSSSSSVCVVS